MDESTNEEHLSQPLQTNFKQFKKAVTFLTGFNGTFNVTNSKIQFSSKGKITNEDDFIQLIIPPGANESESFNSLNIEIKRIIFDKGHFTEDE